MVSNAPPNPVEDEVDEPTQPYSRSEIDRLRQLATLPPQEQVADVERPETTHVVPRGTLTIVPADADEDGGQGSEGWFELDGRWLRVCLRAFEHFGFSGAPFGMVGAVDASCMSGTIGGDGSAALHPGSQRFEVEQPKAPAPRVEPSDSHPHKWKWWLLLAAPLALALAIWAFIRTEAAPVQPTTQDAEQVPADVPDPSLEAEPTDLRPEPTDLRPEGGSDPGPAEAPEVPSIEPIPVIDSRDDLPSKQKRRKSAAQSAECEKHRKSATSAKDDGDWELLLKLAERHDCWSPARKATALQMKALFELDRFGDCVQLGAQGGSEEIKQWVKTCQLNL